MNNPTETASPSYHTSTQNTKLAVEAIKGCGKFSSACHQLYAIIRKARHRTQKTLEEVGKKKLVVTLSPGRQRANQEGKTSSWLMTLPLQICYFDLDPEMALLCAICYTSLICQPNVMVVGLISLRSNVPLIVSCLYWATMRIKTALEIWPVTECGPNYQGTNCE